MYYIESIKSPNVVIDQIATRGKTVLLLLRDIDVTLEDFLKNVNIPTSQIRYVVVPT